MSRPVRPGPEATRLLLASGPVAGAVLVLAAAAASRGSYRRTRIAAAVGPVIVILDAAAVTAVSLAAPALTAGLVIADGASLGRIALTAWTLPRLAAR